MSQGSRGRVCGWRFALLAIIGLGVLGVPLLLSLQPVAWQLNMVARTEVARLQLMDAQSWQLSDAIVCVQSEGQSGVGWQLVDDPACGRRQWKRLVTQGDPFHRALNLSASTLTPIDVQIEIFRSGELRMALRHTDPSQSVGSLLSQDTGQASGGTGAQMNLIWPALTLAQASGYEDGGVAILPFSGGMMVGRDVSWGAQRMLMSGEIAVFSASENHLAGRTVAEQSTLMLGDRVDIVATDRQAGTPKGFVRVNRLASPPEQANTMEVVVYAPAEQATIHRYGGGDYRFEASWWVRLKHQSSLVILLLVVTGLLSILSSLISIAPACRQLFAWCRQRPARKDDNLTGAKNARPEED